MTRRPSADGRSRAGGGGALPRRRQLFGEAEAEAEAQGKGAERQADGQACGQNVWRVLLQYLMYELLTVHMLVVV
jgi:hypothetical protein